MKLWINDGVRDAAIARIDPSDRGFLLGDGLFETLVVRGGVPEYMAEHLARLRRGCEVLRMPYPSVDLERALAETLAANAMTEAVARITWSRGAGGARGVVPPENPAPTLLITVAALPEPLPPARCIIATVTRRNEHSPLSRIKSLNYLDSILARQEACERDADDALLLNGAGHVAEATAANLFIVREGKILTPPVADGALAGVMRDIVMAATGAVEQSLTVQDVQKADEVFLTNSLGNPSTAFP